MNVYKFGGASVKDAEGVKNLFKIINTQRENLIIVVSGKPVILQRFFSAFKISISRLSGIFSVLPTVK